MIIISDQIPELSEFYSIVAKHNQFPNDLKITRKTTISPMDKSVFHHLTKTLNWLNENYGSYRMSVLFSVEYTVNSKLAQAFIQCVEHQISYQTKTSFEQTHDLSKFKYRLTDFQLDLLDYCFSHAESSNNTILKSLNTIKSNLVTLSTPKKNK